YTGRELGKTEEARVRRYVDSVITKGEQHAPERLLDAVALLFHRESPRAREAPLPQVELAGKRVLIVDDDVRNIFALTSILEAQQMQVFYAENGKAGIEALDLHPDVDLILMDVMMPEMDGYETMRAIRKNQRFRTLPIIAITAKALKDDREKCIEA